MKAKSRLLRPLAAVTLLCSVALLMLQGGCNVLGFAASALSGGGTTPAAFTPAKLPMVVIAENFNNPAEAALDAEPIARYTSDALRTHEVAPLIDPDHVSRLREQDPEKFRALTIAGVGRAVDAEQILYVNIIDVEVHLADQSDLIRGRGEVRVRLVDANTAETIWPVGAAQGYSVAAETRIVRRAERSDATVRSDVHRALAERIAQLFFPKKGDG
jgi:hypothetical protein